MSPAAVVGVALGGYLAVVLSFEVFVGVVGRQHAERGVQADEMWIQLTSAVDGEEQSVVVAGVESAGSLYVSANHWPRGWYHRLVAHPDVRVTVKGEESARRAVPVIGEEESRVRRDYPLPVVVRILSGFPPRAFLRLDPAAAAPKGRTT